MVSRTPGGERNQLQREARPVSPATEGANSNGVHQRRGGTVSAMHSHITLCRDRDVRDDEKLGACGDTR
jgi:hypothetical protein